MLSRGTALDRRALLEYLDVWCDRRSQNADEQKDIFRLQSYFRYDRSLRNLPPVRPAENCGDRISEEHQGHQKKYLFDARVRSEDHEVPEDQCGGGHRNILTNAKKLG